MDYLTESDVFSKRHLDAFKEPYTSSVETWWNLKLIFLSLFNFNHQFLASSNKTKVPTTLVLTNSLGQSIDLSTCDSAAKWITISGRYFLKIYLIPSTLQISIFSKAYLRDYSLQNSKKTLSFLHM